MLPLLLKSICNHRYLRCNNVTTWRQVLTLAFK
jgi:hypothetical protein